MYMDEKRKFYGNCQTRTALLTEKEKLFVPEDSSDRDLVMIDDDVFEPSTSQRSK